METYGKEISKSEKTDSFLEKYSIVKEKVRDTLEHCHTPGKFATQHLGSQVVGFESFNVRLTREEDVRRDFFCFDNTKDDGSVVLVLKKKQVHSYADKDQTGTMKFNREREIFFGEDLKLSQYRVDSKVSDLDLENFIEQNPDWEVVLMNNEESQEQPGGLVQANIAVENLLSGHVMKEGNSQELRYKLLDGVPKLNHADNFNGSNKNNLYKMDATWDIPKLTKQEEDLQENKHFYGF